MKLSTVITDKEQAIPYMRALADIISAHNAYDYFFFADNPNVVLDILLKQPTSSVGKWVRHIAAAYPDPPAAGKIERAMTIDMIEGLWHEYLELLPELSEDTASLPATPSEVTSPEDKEMELDVQMGRLAIGHAVSTYLRENNVTITTLAEAAGTSREQIGWIITGKRDPRISTILRVMATMGYGIVFEREK